MAMASVAQLHRDPWSRFDCQPVSLELHFSQLVLVGSKNVYLSVNTLIYLTLKNLSIDNACKCQIISLIGGSATVRTLEGGRGDKQGYKGTKNI